MVAAKIDTHQHFLPRLYVNAGGLETIADPNRILFGTHFTMAPSFTISEGIAYRIAGRLFRREKATE